MLTLSGGVQGRRGLDHLRRESEQNREAKLTLTQSEAGGRSHGQADRNSTMTEDLVGFDFIGCFPSMYRDKNINIGLWMLCE